jgi:hypothetical protein
VRPSRVNRVGSTVDELAMGKGGISTPSCPWIVNCRVDPASKSVADGHISISSATISAGRTFWMRAWLCHGRSGVLRDGSSSPCEARSHPFARPKCLGRRIPWTEN